MIKEGHEQQIKYWGKYKVKKIVKLKEPVICHSEEIGEAEFMPTIVRLEWEKLLHGTRMTFGSPIG